MGWVLDGMFTHGAPLKVHKMLIVREWGERSHYLVEMGLDNDPYVLERVYEKWANSSSSTSCTYLNGAIPATRTITVVSDLKALYYGRLGYRRLESTRLRRITNTIKGPVMGVAFGKTAQNKATIDELKGRGYEHVGYGGDFAL